MPKTAFRVAEAYGLINLLTYQTTDFINCTYTGMGYIKPFLSKMLYEKRF